MIDKAKVMEVLEAMDDDLNRGVYSKRALYRAYEKIKALPDEAGKVYREGDEVPEGIYVLFCDGYQPDLLFIDGGFNWHEITEGCNPRLVRV